MHGLVVLDEHDEVLRPAILWNDQRTAAECDLIRAADRARSGSSQITGNDALTGLTAPKLVWVRDHEPTFGAGSRTSAAQGLSPAATDGRARDGQGGRLRHAAVRPCRARLVGRSRRRAGHRRRLAAANVRGPARSPAPSRAAAAEATGLVAGTPVVAGGGDQSANAVGVGAVIEPGAMALSVGTSGVVFATHRASAIRAARPSACLLPRRARSMAHDVGHALGGRQPALVARRPRARRPFR